MIRRTRGTHTIVVAALTLCALLWLALSTWPRTASADLVGTLTVNTNTISDNANDGKCDLYEALQAIVQANLSGQSATYHECSAVAGLNIVTFGGAAAANPIAMTTTKDLPFVWGKTTIMGPVTIIGIGKPASQRVFQLGQNASLTLNLVTIKGAHTSGSGAAIYDNNHGTINVLASSFVGNQADSDGGAIESNGTLNIAGSNFSGNQAGVSTGSGFGGAIHMSGAGSLKLAATNFAGNIAKSGGGALWFGAQTGEVSDAVFNGNITTPITPTTSGGGAIFNNSNSRLSIVRSAFSGNLSPASKGGALYNSTSATIVITDSSFNANVAGTSLNIQYGGAIYNQSSLSIVRSAFIANLVAKGDGGAIADDRGGTLNVANTTFTANGAPLGNGGALAVENTQQGSNTKSSATLLNVTLSANVASNGNGQAVFVGSGHSLSSGNTIFDGSASNNCAGTLTSLGHNLDSGNSCGFANSGKGDLVNANANLDTPFFNGGPIASLLSQKLLAGSQAIDTGDNALCANPPVNNEDQRSHARPIDGDGNGTAICDIGAFENPRPFPKFASKPVQPGPIDIGNATFGTTITATIVVSNVGDATLTLSNRSLGGTNAGEFSVLTGFPLNLSVGGAPQNLVVGCTPAGPNAGARSATLSFNTNDPDHTSVSYNLSCNGMAAPAAGFGSSPIAPGPITFNSTLVGTASTATIMIMNTGNATLNVTGANLGGVHPADFTVLSAPPTIAAGGAPQPLNLRCIPSEVGLRMATLLLGTNDPNKSQVTFNLSCPGILPPQPFLTYMTSIALDPNGTGMTGIAVSPDGKNVYATEYFSGTVLAFTRAVTDGALSFIAEQGVIFNLLAGARLIAASPDGKHVYAAGETNGTLVTFSRDQTSGKLTPSDAQTKFSYAGLNGAYGVALSPDGQFVYVTGKDGNAVVVFSRDPDSGAPTYVQTIQDSSNLAGARGLALSPDGAHLYVTSSTNGNLVLYRRNAVDGTLTYVKTYKNATGFCFFDCIYGLNGANQVAVSPDGAHVYAVSFNDNALAVFQRNAANGTLTFITDYVDGVGGVDGLARAWGVTVSADGAHVVTTGYFDSAATIFDRDAATGLLTVNQVIQRNPPFGGINIFPPLWGAEDVRMSPDGRSAYVASYIDNWVTVLQVANPQPTLSSLLPASAVQGSGPLTVTLNGSNFIASSLAWWLKPGNVFPSPRPTTFVNNQQLLMQLDSFDVNDCLSPCIVLVFVQK